MCVQSCLHHMGHKLLTNDRMKTHYAYIIIVEIKNVGIKCANYYTFIKSYYTE